MANRTVADLGSFTFNFIRLLNPSVRAPPQCLNGCTTSLFPSMMRLPCQGHRSGAEQLAKGPTQMENGVCVANSQNSVTMKKQPFYDDEERLLFAFFLAPVFHVSQSFKFRINKIAAKRLGGHDNVILLRFCSMESVKPQDDKFPPGLVVLVNGLPFETKGGPFPMNITSLCNISIGANNCVKVWTSSGPGTYYVISVSLVKRLTVDDLIHKLNATKPFEIKETKAMTVRGGLHNSCSDDLETTSVECSLMCPLSMTRITVPCRARSCKHVQVFDALGYLRMNAQKSNWICPICHFPALFTNLVIDRYFQGILKEADTCNKICLLNDGKWTPVVNCNQEENATKRQRVAKKRVADEVVIIDSDDEACCKENGYYDFSKNVISTGEFMKKTVIGSETRTAVPEIGSETVTTLSGRGPRTALPHAKRCRESLQADCTESRGPLLRSGSKKVTKRGTRSRKGA